MKTKNAIAEVAIPISIALNEVFDYLIPQDLSPKVEVGCRVLVPFRNFSIMGYVTRLKNTSPYKNKLKPILNNLDSTPVINEELFELADILRRRYFCSLADAIHTVLPSGLKNSKKPIPTDETNRSVLFVSSGLSREEGELLADKELQKPLVLIQDLSEKGKWPVYSALIKQTLKDKKSVIFLVPDHQKIKPALEHMKIGIEPFIISSNIPPAESVGAWIGIKNSDLSFVIGTRSAIFAPVNNLGLVIIEDEGHFAYRQDQVPHYHATKIALERARKYTAKLVLGSFTPLLETISWIKDAGGGYLRLGGINSQPDIKLIDMRQERGFKARDRIISGVLEHRVADCLQRGVKMLIFANKKGFSTFLYCKKCKTIQTCPRCSSSLIYNFKEKTVSCPKCPYAHESIDLCPVCRSAYVKYFGYGIEKVESELLRLFPSAKIALYGPAKAGDYDIMLATQSLLEDPAWSGYAFDTVAVLSCEQMLGHVDFRSTEVTFARLLKLLFLANGQFLIQTRVLENNALTSLQHRDIDAFYDNELKQREELGLPPATQLAALAIRSKKQANSEEGAEEIFKSLKNRYAKTGGVKIFEPLPAIPLKVRGNYRYQILIKYKELEPVLKALNSVLKKRNHNLIITFDPAV
ncbi:MAG TPA: primosomal protein N' [Candidatus Omnitrophica bacterium]|nr:primosomal protein N' [Candidatus Omnitrophota bacterium]